VVTDKRSGKVVCAYAPKGWVLFGVKKDCTVLWTPPSQDGRV
jgi:hypothetical protein